MGRPRQGGRQARKDKLTRRTWPIRSRLGSDVPLITCREPRPQRRNHEADFRTKSEDLLSRFAECNWKIGSPVAGYRPECVAHEADIHHLKQPSPDPALQLHCVPTSDVDPDLPGDSECNSRGRKVEMLSRCRRRACRKEAVLMRIPCSLSLLAPITEEEDNPL